MHTKADKLTEKAVSVPEETGGAGVDAYLAKLTEPQRSTLEAVRQSIRGCLPVEAAEGFSYGMPAFILKKPVAGYAAWKEHCSYYPMSGKVITRLKDELTDYGTSSGAIRFPSDKPLLVELIRKLIAARLEEIAAPKRKK